MERLGLESLIGRWVKTGSANPGRKVLTVVAAMMAGATHIDHVNMLRAGATQAVLGFRVMAPSTIGTFLRSFTFGHVRQLDAVMSRTLARAWSLAAGPGAAPLVVDLDSTICEVHGKKKQGAAYGYTKHLGYHPLLATRASTGEILLSRMRKGSAGSSRGINRFVNELAAVLKQAGATGPITVRADSAFWSKKLIERFNKHDMKWSITVTNHTSIHKAIAQIPDDAWTDIDYTLGGQAQVAETIHTTGGGKTKRKQRNIRLIVRRTRLTNPDQAALWPEWRHHSFITNTTLDPVAADQFHRQHAVVELAIKDLKEGTGAHHIPSGHYGANAAWFACAVLAHNLGHWITILANQPPTTHKTRRVRYIALAAILVNRSRQHTLRFPARWPWANQLHHTLTAIRALPQPSG